MGQPPIPPTPADTNLVGKTILITGGNSGIGLEAARQFLALQASRVIITSRDKAKGEAAVATLRQSQPANSSAVIDCFHLDLDDYQSVLRFCEKVKKDVSCLNILVCNGGVGLDVYQISKSGHERVMQVNCYSHFLIILKLLPLIRTTSKYYKTPSCITFTGSEMQAMTTLLPEKSPLTSKETVYTHFDKKNNFGAIGRRYADSKLVVNAFVRHLATVVPSSEVLVNNFCPGMVLTAMDRNSSLWIRAIMKIVRALRARTVEEGTRTLIYATAVVGEETHGKFLASNKITESPFLDQDAGKEFMDRLWKDTVAEMASLDPSLKFWSK